MASLTHVCMWSDNGWKRITAEQAARLHPGGTVSAHSGLFMCELCGQYVILTDGDIRIRYFKHSAYEKSKDCPERTFGAGYSISYGSQEHDLPIRITNVSSSSFSFEVGLIRAPISSLGKDFCIEIKPKGAFDIPYVYTKERLNYDSITYLPIGERPFEKYTLSFQNGNDKLREFWPAEIKGIDPEGTLFEKVSGKKLSYDADVEIGKEYYLLKRGYIYRKSFSSVRIQEIMQKRIGWETWSLYVVSASAFNEDAARFYLDFHCRLTDHPISLQPVWPLFVEGNYIVMLSRWNVHNEQVLRMMKKAVSFRPIVDIQKFITENICDIPEKPDIEAMQQNIRDYKRHEMLAQRQEEKLTALQEISKLYREMNQAIERWRVQSFLVLWSKKEVEQAQIDRFELEKKDRTTELNAIEESITAISAQITQKEGRRRELDLACAQSSVFQEEEKLRTRKQALLNEQEKLIQDLQSLALEIKRESFRLNGLCDSVLKQDAEEILLPVQKAA